MLCQRVHIEKVRSKGCTPNQGCRQVKRSANVEQQGWYLTDSRRGQGSRRRSRSEDKGPRVGSKTTFGRSTLTGERIGFGGSGGDGGPRMSITYGGSGGPTSADKSNGWGGANCSGGEAKGAQSGESWTMMETSSQLRTTSV
mgnify:CR=1 FL=1